MSTILITGANRGIGLELARCFARDDWRVLACCRSPELSDELQALAAQYDRLSMHPLEVVDRAQIAGLATQLKTEAIDILVNNAGVRGPLNQGFGETDPEAWLETFEVNCIAPMMISEAFVEMVARSRLRIIAAVGSVMGSIAENSSGGHYAYRTSKAAVHMLAKGLSVDLADRGIISVALHPGWVRTRMGGPEAPLSVEASAQGVKKVLLGLSSRDSGCLIDPQGTKRPW